MNVVTMHRYTVRAQSDVLRSFGCFRGSPMQSAQRNATARRVPMAITTELHTQPNRCPSSARSPCPWGWSPFAGMRIFCASHWTPCVLSGSNATSYCSKCKQDCCELSAPRCQEAEVTSQTMACKCDHYTLRQPHADIS
mmetsp:Transcript_26897/g.64038  ORF Transcript_26897/g.64038 Transcript_26897/m.64038 type:complete len:139 (+) Transcript_26897:1400-1816(+)